MAVDLAALQSQIADLGLQWRAGTTTNSNHSELQARTRTGYVPGPDDFSLEEAERVAVEGHAASVAARAAGLPGGPAAPAAFDWRNRAGLNYVTPIEDQGGCGSCVAFGAVAAVESLVRISRGTPTASVDLSEAHLWFCWGPSHGAGACPAGGWWPDAAYDGLKQGIVDSACYPYTAANQACNLCPDWQNRLTKITGWHHLTSQADMKAFISTVGPVSACFTVYEDFYYHYTGGVYTYNAATAGNVVGGHCICIVGYDDSQGCWIAKNQWGAGWGESGYFRMSYGSCGLDAQMWAPEGIVGGSPGSRLEVFARGSDDALWHMWQTAPNNGWSGWASLGGWIDAPVITRNTDGRLEVFVIGSDHALWHMWQTAPNNGWSGWASLGGWIDELTVGQNADGRLEVFARGSDHALWHIWQTAPGSGWSGWASLGGWIDAPVISRNADGRLEVFVIGSDHALWHIWQTAPNNGWSGWASLGGWIDEFTVGQNADGRMEVFARGSDHALWHMWQTAPSNGWSGWASLGGGIDLPRVSRNADGRLEVFVIGTGALWHMWQTAPNSGWSGWASLGGWIDELTIGQNADGRMEVFARGSDHALWHMWQTAPSNGWSGWASLGGWIDRLAVGQNAPVGASAAPPAMPGPAMSDASAGAMPTAGMLVAGSAVSAPSGGTMPAPAMAALPSGEEGAMPLPATEQVVTAMPAPQTPD
jgi:C1A family cysteine protease